jgi:tetratricopeptide (TPR) repeat protein
MTNKLLRWLFLITAAVFCQTGCQTGKPIKRMSNDGFMYAMIYDYDNSPVTGVTVWLDGKKTVDSDIQGRFILEKMKKGEYSVKLAKKGYEAFEEVFHYDPLQVLYFKIINASQLLALAETALDNAEFAKAESYLNRALLIDPNRTDILFLKSVNYYLQGRNAEAADTLENIIKSGSADPSISQLLEIIREVQDHEG